MGKHENGIKITVATVGDIKRARNGEAVHGSNGSCLVRISSKSERMKVYEEMAEEIAIHESAALVPSGGRPWKCLIKISDPPPPTQYQKRMDKRGPLFRWYKGKLELAALPHFLEKIPEIEIRTPSCKQRRNKDPEDDEEDGFLSYVDSMQRQRRLPCELSMEASDPTLHPQPLIQRTWISPQRVSFKSRKAAQEESDRLDQRELLIDRVLFGRGARGQRLKGFKPTIAQTLQAGAARFDRDGLWVVGQEEEWQVERAMLDAQKALAERCGSDTCSTTSTVQSQSTTKTSQATDLVRMSSESVSGDESFKYTWLSTPSSLSKDPSPLVTPSSPLSAAEDITEREEVSSENSNSTPPLSSSSSSGTTWYKPPVQEELLTKETRAQRKKKKFFGCESEDEVEFPPKRKKKTPVTTGKKPRGRPPKRPSNGAHVPTPAPAPVPAPAPAPAPAPRKKKSSKGAEFKPSKRWRLTKDQVELCYYACLEHYEKVMHTVKSRSLFAELAEGFDKLRERGRGRYDMELDAFDTPQFSFLTDVNAPWMEIVHAILGNDGNGEESGEDEEEDPPPPTLIHKGCFLSLPGAAAQVYHQDGPHLSYKAQKPCHAVNVFIPLVDLSKKNGPTEFCLGTHMLDYEGYARDMCETPLPPAGTPIIFDYRLGHRGLANVSDAPRPLLYLTYARGGSTFRDGVNFSRKRYHRLGELTTPAPSREERAARRKKMKGEEEEEVEEEAEVEEEGVVEDEEVLEDCSSEASPS